jgi:hypothetical protein
MNTWFPRLAQRALLVGLLRLLRPVGLRLLVSLLRPVEGLLVSLLVVAVDLLRALVAFPGRQLKSW